MEEQEEGVSMVDVLKEEEMMEEDANAVLGGSDDKNCTYDMGYINRQALYACVNCTKDMEQPAGVCLACCLECHEGHELYELYTKRDFRCDCGNVKMSKECKLRPNKLVNTDNKYNQNFRGKYCTCHRPYPDPENPDEDDMIQCIICEDWYHGEHLKTKVPANDNFDEMICFGCVANHPFLASYRMLALAPATKVESAETTDPVDVEKTECDKKETDSKSETEEKKPEPQESSDKVAAPESAVAKEESAVSNPQRSEAVKAAKPDTSTNESRTSTDEKPTEELPSCSSQQTEEKPGCSKDMSSDDVKECYLTELQKGQAQPDIGTIFMTEGWRKKLCRCEKCKKMYSEEKVEYLLLEDDTVQAYEDRGKAKSGHSQYDKGMEALHSLGRVQQVEAFQEYHDLKSSLTSYLKKFADNKKVVRPEDIQEFFAGLQARKKQRTQETVQNFCR